MWILYALACGAGTGGEPEPTRVTVVVAARDLSVGVPIVADDLSVVPMDVRFAPEGAFGAPGQVIGRVPYERILAGEPIRGRRLADPELQQQLEAMVPRDHTVLTFDLEPGGDRPPVPGVDRVDVRAGGQVVAAGLQILRVDRQRVAAIADPEQLEKIEAARSWAALTVSIGASP